VTRREHLGLWAAVGLASLAACAARIWAPATSTRDRHRGLARWFTEGTRPLIGPADATGNPGHVMEWASGGVVGRGTAAAVLTIALLAAVATATYRLGARRLSGVWPALLTALTMTASAVWVSESAVAGPVLVAVAATLWAQVVITSPRPTPWLVVGLLVGVALWATPAALVIVAALLASAGSTRTRPDTTGAVLVTAGLAIGALPRILTSVRDGADGVGDLMQSIGWSAARWESAADALWAAWITSDDSARRWPLVAAVAAAIAVPALVMLWRRPSARDTMLVPLPVAVAVLVVCGPGADTVTCVAMTAPSMAWWVTVALSALPQRSRPTVSAVVLAGISAVMAIGVVTTEPVISDEDRDDLVALESSLAGLGAGAIRVESSSAWAVIATVDLPATSERLDRPSLSEAPRRTAVIVDLVDGETVWTTVVDALTVTGAVDLADSGRWRAAVTDSANVAALTFTMNE